MIEEEPLDSHTIELAETRPTMVSLTIAGFGFGFLGEVPLNVAILLAGAAGLCFTWGGIKWTLWFPIIWWTCSYLVRTNYNGLTHVQQALATGMGFCLDRKIQGGVSATPMPEYMGKIGKYRGMT